MVPSAVLATGTGVAPNWWIAEHISAVGLAAAGLADKAATPEDTISTARTAASSFCITPSARPVNCRPSLGAPPSSSQLDQSPNPAWTPVGPRHHIHNATDPSAGQKVGCRLALPGRRADIFAGPQGRPTPAFGLAALSQAAYVVA